jgi:hypothetical protein
MKSLADYVAKHCLSEWEGCICGKRKYHEGMHSCASPSCDCTWTDAQEDEWWRSFREKYRLVAPDQPLPPDPEREAKFDIELMKQLTKPLTSPHEDDTLSS